MGIARREFLRSTRHATSCSNGFFRRLNPAQASSWTPNSPRLQSWWAIWPRTGNAWLPLPPLVLRLQTVWRGASWE